GRIWRKILQAAFVRSIACSLEAQGRSPDLQVIACWRPSRFILATVAILNASPLAAYSGATVRDFHPLPFSLANGCEHLRLKQADASKQREKRSISFSWRCPPQTGSPKRQRGSSRGCPSLALRALRPSPPREQNSRFILLTG